MDGEKEITHKVVAAEDSLQTYVTDDHSLFKQLESNRNVDKAHVRKLMQVFENKPHAIRNRPILVNENMEVIDGQHRLAALAELGYPVYYQIGKGLGLEETIQINAVQKNWKPIDYAISYATRGNQNYAIYLAYHKRYPTITHSQLMHYILGAETKRMTVEFKNGDFLVKDEPDEITKRIEQYLDIVTLVPDQKYSRSFQKAVLFVIRHPQYDHKRMLHKLSYAAGKHFPTVMATTAEALRGLEGVYNENAREGDTMRLF